MKEIKTVIDKLKEKKELLERENEADLKSINEKQNSINSLTSEISELQGKMEARKQDMAKLDQKMSEAQAFDKSIEEVAPLIKENEEVKEEPKEVLAEEKPVIPEVHNEENLVDTKISQENYENTNDKIEPDNKKEKEIYTEEKKEIDPLTNFNYATSNKETNEEMVNPFSDLTSEDIKLEDFNFKESLGVENAQPEEISTNTVMPQENVAKDQEVPVFDENGFNINTNPENVASSFPNIGLNEIYNNPSMEQNPSMMVR